MALHAAGISSSSFQFHPLPSVLHLLRSSLPPLLPTLICYSKREGQGGCSDVPWPDPVRQSIAVEFADHKTVIGGSAGTGREDGDHRGRRSAATAPSSVEHGGGSDSRHCGDLVFGGHLEPFRHGRATSDPGAASLTSMCASRTWSFAA